MRLNVKKIEEENEDKISCIYHGTPFTGSIEEVDFDLLTNSMTITIEGTVSTGFMNEVLKRVKI
jgi:hypothetical protein